MINSQTMRSFYNPHFIVKKYTHNVFPTISSFILPLNKKLLVNQLYRTGVRTGELKCFPVTSVVVRGSESEAEPCKELGSGTVGKSLFE